MLKRGRVHKAKSLPKEKFKDEVQEFLTGTAEASDLLYFKVYKSQLPVIEKALELGARMLGSDKSRAYCLEMICADFLAGATAEVAIRNELLCSAKRLCKFLPAKDKRNLDSSVDCRMNTKRISGVRIESDEYSQIRLRVLERDG